MPATTADERQRHDGVAVAAFDLLMAASADSTAGGS